MATAVPTFAHEEQPQKRCKVEHEQAPPEVGATSFETTSGAKVLTKAEKAAFRAKFYRSMESKGQRPARTAKCPPQLALRLREDAQGLGRWFNLFCECEGDWTTFGIRFNQTDLQRRSREGQRD